MPYNFAADSFHTKKLRSRLSSNDFRQKLAFLGFRAPLGALRGNIRWSSQAHWKTQSVRPISVNWTFFARCYGWGATSEYRLKIIDFAPTGAGWPKISGRRCRPHQPFFLSGNYAKWSFVPYKNLDRPFFHFCHKSRVWQTDGQTEFSSLYRVCIPCSVVKMIARAEP